MGEEIALENGQISDFHVLVTLTLTSDRVILHTVMHHSSTSTYIPNSLKSKKLFVDKRTDIWDPLMLLGRLGGVDLTISGQRILTKGCIIEEERIFQGDHVMLGALQSNIMPLLGIDWSVLLHTPKQKLPVVFNGSNDPPNCPFLWGS